LEIILNILYLVLWASVWVSFVMALGCAVTSFFFKLSKGSIEDLTRLEGIQKKSDYLDYLMRGTTGWGILGIFALLLIEALGLYR